MPHTPEDLSPMTALLKDLRWRIDDIRDMLLKRNGRDESIYGCDEWSTPVLNLQRAVNKIDEALTSPTPALPAEREAFEAHYAAIWKERTGKTESLAELVAVLVTMRDGDDYDNGQGEKPAFINNLWQGWQARAALRPQSAPTEAGGVAEAPKLSKKDLNKLLNDFARACAFGDDALARMAASKAIHEYLDAAFDALSTLPASSPAAGAGVALPAEASDAMCEAAMEAHYGARRVRACGGARGIDMTVDDNGFDGLQAFRRMWRGAMRALAASPSCERQDVGGDRG